MRYVQITLFAVLLLAAPLRADNASDRAGLLGSWQQPPESGKEAAVWVLQMKGMSLHITESVGAQAVSEFECPPKGAECEGTAEGKKASVSLYYDGPALVEIETRGSDVTRRKFMVAKQSDTLDIEVMPIVGDNKAETLHLKRIRLSTQNR